jgi:hypothetical protein
MDRQEVCFLVLLDLSSAFDTIDHKTIIAVLEYQFGVTDKALTESRELILITIFLKSAMSSMGFLKGAVLAPYFFYFTYPNYMTL